MSKSKDEDCIPCTLKGGVGLMLDLCEIYKFNNTDCSQVKEDLFDGKTTLDQTLNILLDGARATPPAHNEFDAVIDLMKKNGVIKDA